jgi:hypothetical protein
MCDWLATGGSGLYRRAWAKQWGDDGFMSTPGEPAMILRAARRQRALAPMLDIILVLAISGQAIGAVTAGVIPGSRDLQGGPELALFTIIANVIIGCIGCRCAGGMMWVCSFGRQRPQPL